MGLGRRLRRTESGWASPSRRQLWGKAEGQKRTGFLTKLPLKRPSVSKHVTSAQQPRAGEKSEL